MNEKYIQIHNRLNSRSYLDYIISKEKSKLYLNRLNKLNFFF